MKEKIKFIAFLVIALGLFGTFEYRRGYDEGRNYGVGLGVQASLDTVKQILFKQLDNDSCATELIFEGDTMSYVLTKKRLVDAFISRE